MNKVNVNDISDVILYEGEKIEEVYDDEDEGDSGYCIMKYNDKFYFCGFDFGGSLGCIEEYDSLEVLRKEVKFN
jgi:hypothetical protein